MYEGYLELGGNEVINSARSVGYTTSVDCPVNWLVCPPCDGVADVLGHAPYHYDNISEAPWYDEQDEPTHRFLGAHGIRFEGVPDSTREASVQEGIMDGGVVGRVRRATRRVRVEAMLTALGEDALEVGFSWLESALTPGLCGTHGDACGAADARFYAACPPSRSEVTTPVPVWNEPVTNLVLNPSMETSGPEVVIGTNLATNPSFEANTGMDVELRRNQHANPRMVSGGHGWQTLQGGTTVTVGTTGQTFNVPAAIGASNWVALHGEFMTAATTGKPIISSVEVEVPAGFPAVTLKWEWEERLDLAGDDPDDPTAVVTNIIGPETTIYAGEVKRVSLPEGSVLGTTTRGRAKLVAGAAATAVPAGARFILRKMLTEFSSATRPYFDGSTSDAGDFTYLWVGTPDASQSVEYGKVVAGIPAPYGATAYQTSDAPQDRSKAVRFRLVGGGGVALALTSYTPTAGSTYTLLGRVRPNHRDQQMQAQIGTTKGPLFTAPKGVWTEFRETLAATDASATNTGLNLTGTKEAGDEIDVDAVVLVEGTYIGPYFDGASAGDPDLTFAWEGTADASASTVSVVGVANIAIPPSDQAKQRQTSDSPARGAHALRYEVQSAPAVGLSATDVLPDTGTVYTLVGKVRPRTRDEKLAPRIRAAAGPVFTAPKDVWTSFRLTIAAGAGGVQQTGLLMASNSGHKPGDIIDIDEVLLIEGAYGGPYFDGSFPDSSESDYEIVGSKLIEFDWTGTPDASTSTFRTGNVTEVEDPEAYEDKIYRLVRNLHTVTCVAGPLVIQKFHRDDTWGYLVEFVIVAAVPWMYGDTRPVDLAPSIPVVIQDVPFNLVPYPSAELAEGSVIAATNLAKNPSVEANTTDWAVGGDTTVIASSSIVLERTTELEAHGSSSARAKFTAPNSGSNGYFYVQTTVSLAGYAAGTRFSVNLWATASVESGTAVLGDLEYSIYWLNSSNSSIREDTIHVGASAGGAFSAKSLLPPAGAVSGRLRALQVMTSFSSGAVVRLYADAAAVSVP